MANLTGLGEQYFLTMAQGGLAAQYTTGYDRIGLYDDNNVLIGAVQTITWRWTSGKASIYMNKDPLFNIPAGTTVKGLAVFCSGVRNAGTVSVPDIEFSTSGDLDFSDALVRIETNISLPKLFVNAGTTEVASLTYNFERMDL